MLKIFPEKDVHVIFFSSYLVIISEWCGVNVLVNAQTEMRHRHADGIRVRLPQDGHKTGTASCTTNVCLYSTTCWPLEQLPQETTDRNL